MKYIDLVNLDGFPDELVSRNNFEDCLGHYSLLGEGLSRKRAHQDFLRCHHMKKQEFRKNIMLLYPDRNEGIDMGTQEVNEVEAN